MLAQLYAQLISSDTFTTFLDAHPRAICSHFFSALTGELAVKGNWEIGFFDEGMYVFDMKDPIVLRARDEVVGGSEVEEFDVKRVKVDFDEACSHFITLRETEKIVTKDGFVVLQMFDSQPCWNFTLITATLKFWNVKVNCENGEVVHSEFVELVQKM